MNLYEIEQFYRQGKSLSEINEIYQEGLSEVKEDEQLAVWKQVCVFANFEMIDQLINIGWRAMGVEDPYGNTLLHLMAEPINDSYVMPEGRIYETTKRLLANKISPMRKNANGETALMIGAKSGYHEMLQFFHENGIKIDWVNSEGNTLLHLAAQSSSRFVSDLSKETKLDQFIRFVSMGMEYGLNPSQKNNYGETAVDFAIRYNSKIIGAMLNGLDLANQELAPLFIETGGKDVFQACITKDLAALDSLIKLGANLNEEYDKEGDRYAKMLPLSIAVTLHDFEIVDLLLKSGADPQLIGSKSWHPLRYLYTTEAEINTSFNDFENKNFQKILKSFVTAGFDLDSLVDDDEHTILTISAKHADRLQLHNGNSTAKSIIQEAVYLNADVNKTNRDGVSALMYLCVTDLRRSENELLMLLEQGALVDLKDKDGKTALIYATNNSDKSTAKTYCELLDQFGNIIADAVDNSEKSALDYAVERDNENLVAWLLERQ